ncbi:hypothetical protein K431DRAFT_195722, partial [Polychaeton citri CBS 116435]
WIPFGVRDLPDFAKPDITNGAETFTSDFIQRALEGKNWSPGFYYNPESQAAGYWLLNGDHEPFAPKVACQHGAKLTAFFNNTASAGAPEDEAYTNAAVFIRLTRSESGEYTYMGSYTSPRMSDKVGYDTMREHVPDSVLRYWASMLASSKKPDWCAKALVDHLWPMDDYAGPVPTDPVVESVDTTNLDGCSGLEARVQRGLEAWVHDLASWKKEVDMKATMLNEENLYKAFFAADADLEPGLRLWWEYLQCTGYDEELYRKLVAMK